MEELHQTNYPQYFTIIAGHLNDMRHPEIKITEVSVYLKRDQLYECYKQCMAWDYKSCKEISRVPYGERRYLKVSIRTIGVVHFKVYEQMEEISYNPKKGDYWI